MSAKTQNISQYGNLVSEIGKLLSEAKKHIANTVNTTMVMTNWHIGKYIVEYEQGGKVRAGYGKQLLKRLSEDLIKTYGRGYSYRNLQLCKKFYTTFPIVQTVIAQLENSEKSEYPDKEKVQTNSAQFSEKLLASLPKLSWSHFVRLLSLKNEDERNFYIIETAENHWTERELDRQINSALFERLVLSKDKKAVKELSTGKLKQKMRILLLELFSVKKMMILSLNILCLKTTNRFLPMNINCICLIKKN